MYLVSWHYKVDFRHCNKEKHVGKPVNSSVVLTPDVSGILALQGRLRHCNKEKHVGKPVNSSGVLTPDVSGILALQGRFPSL